MIELVCREKMTVSRTSKMLNYINFRMRITIQDGRQLVGRFMAFDKHMNVVLGDAEEFRKLPPKKGMGEVRRNIRRRGKEKIETPTPTPRQLVLFFFHLLTPTTLSLSRARARACVCVCVWFVCSQRMGPYRNLLPSTSSSSSSRERRGGFWGSSSFAGRRSCP